MRPFRFLALGSSAAAAACAAAARTPPPPPSPSPAPAAASSPSSSAAAREAPLATTDASVAEAPDTGEPAPEAASAAAEADAGERTTGGDVIACNEQAPQDFLVRGNFLKGGPEAMRRAIQYRTDTYGYFKGFGRAPAGAEPPSAFVVKTTFMGLPVRMHRKVVPALHCVEQEIRRSCAEHPYTPHALAGIRFRNTYRGGEVTNHIYGIAIDVDPSINTCCGCVPPWNDAPACKRPAKTEYDRMSMPECWVHAFERYGFYWLGHDRLRDTMHFEFLGDPDKILKAQAKE